MLWFCFITFDWFRFDFSNKNSISIRFDIHFFSHAVSNGFVELCFRYADSQAQTAHRSIILGDVLHAAARRRNTCRKGRGEIGSLIRRYTGGRGNYMSPFEGWSSRRSMEFSRRIQQSARRGCNYLALNSLSGNTGGILLPDHCSGVAELRWWPAREDIGETGNPIPMPASCVVSVNRVMRIMKFWSTSVHRFWPKIQVCSP